LQQAARITQQHLAVIGQRDRSGGAAEQRPLGDELEALICWLTVDCVRLARSAARWKPPAFRHRNKRAQKFEFHHGD
jgi:hypothetical protein